MSGGVTESLRTLVGSAARPGGKTTELGVAGAAIAAIVWLAESGGPAWAAIAVGGVAAVYVLARAAVKIAAATAARRPPCGRVVEQAPQGGPRPTPPEVRRMLGLADRPADGPTDPEASVSRVSGRPRPDRRPDRRDAGGGRQTRQATSSGGPDDSVAWTE